MKGFACEAHAVGDATDIAASVIWRRLLAAPRQEVSARTPE
jgi:hypothetical protein